MRRVIYGAACSLDGFIAGVDGNIDWLHFSPDVQEYIGNFWTGIDTILMGRKTFSAAPGGSTQKRTRRKVKATPSRPKKAAGPYAGMRSIVFSRTLDVEDYPDVEIVSGNAGKFVSELKEDTGKNICVMGGGELARSLFEEGLIDEVGLNVHPVLLGAGVPFFRDAGRVALQLIESRVIDGGCVLSTYEVKRR